MSDNRRAFTLIELLVTIGVITLLTAVALPVINHVRDSGKRTAELSNLRQLTSACIQYAQNNDGSYPPGRIASAPAGQDDYTWISYNNCWSKLVALMPGLKRLTSCYSVREGYPDVDDFGQPGNEYSAPYDTRLGWIYWAGRDDLTVGGQVQYRSLRRQGQRLTPGSQTLWTCMCWDSASHGGPSPCPHVAGKFVLYPAGVAVVPPPEGLSVGLDDGSASFVHWTDLVIIPQSNGWKLYYQP